MTESLKSALNIDSFPPLMSFRELPFTVSVATIKDRELNQHELVIFLFYDGGVIVID